MSGSTFRKLGARSDGRDVEALSLGPAIGQRNATELRRRGTWRLPAPSTPMPCQNGTVYQDVVTIDAGEPRHVEPLLIGDSVIRSVGPDLRHDRNGSHRSMRYTRVFACGRVEGACCEGRARSSNRKCAPSKRERGTAPPFANDHDLGGRGRPGARCDREPTPNDRTRSILVLLSIVAARS